MAIKYRIIFLLTFFAYSCTQKSKGNEVEQWIDEHKVELKTVLPESDFADLSPLKNMVGDARIVSLGEPTHGNKEVFLLKHRMIEYLVAEMGFTVFALECPFGEALDINSYVIDGIGDPEKALAGIYLWTWDTKEVLALIQWMRDYNANPSHVKKVKFYGFDPQDPERAAKVILDYLSKVDKELEEKVRPELEILSVPFSLPTYLGRRPYIPEEYDEASFAAIKNVVATMKDSKEIYINNSSTQEWEMAYQHALQVLYYVEANTANGENYSRVRDLGQAKNIQWILDHEGEDAKLIAWAHNAHVNNSPRNNNPMMGYHLKEWYEDQVKIFGFFFNQGGFKALDEGLPSKGIHDFTVSPAPKGTLEYSMAKTKSEICILDLACLPDEGGIYDWFHTPIPTRYSWGGYDEESEERFWNYKLADEFDALVYLDKTSPVEYVNESDFNEVWLLDKKLVSPTNTNFEEISEDTKIPGWVTWTKFERLGVAFSLSDEKPFEGQYAARIHWPKSVTYGEFSPNLIQQIDAVPFRGKRIRLSMAARKEMGDDGFAFARLAIDPAPIESAHETADPLFDSLDKVRITSESWKVYEVEAFVPEDAGTISYGLFMSGFGTVWMDGVRLEVVE